VLFSLACLRTVQLQLQQRTYTAQTVAVLQQVAAEVDGALGQATARLQQVRMRLARVVGQGARVSVLVG
jgi:hypothetical protein